MPRGWEPTAGQPRAGGRVLLLLSDPVNVSILRLLAAGERRKSELTEQIEGASRSTQFNRLGDLEALGILIRESLGGVPRQALYKLSGAGLNLLPAMGLLEAWLGGAIAEPIEHGSTESSVALRALAAGWNSTILRWLADQPRSLTELDPLIEAVGYPELRRALRALAEAGLIEEASSDDRRHPYTVSRWAREATTPLVATIRWEREHLPERSAAVSRLDNEAILLLAAPLVELPPETEGDCTLLVDGLGGVSVTVKAGQVTFYAPKSEPGPEGWVRGPAAAWRTAMDSGQLTTLQTHGDNGFAGALVTAFAKILYANSSIRRNRSGVQGPDF